jgi:DNA-binding transcriptional regulator YdaS (Cro superfamily)
MEKGARQAIQAAGGRKALARLLGISKQAVQKWTRVPADRIIDVERVTGVPREKLRPDLYR